MTVMWIAITKASVDEYRRFKCRRLTPNNIGHVVS